jgi:hypothetical protein
MLQTLPQLIADYFQAKSHQNPDEVLACFAPNAVVHDTGEDKTLTGHDQIRDWLTGTIAAYNLTTELIKTQENQGETIVTALVSGDFPGSPIQFDYGFVVTNNKIDRLVIR